MTEKNGKNIDTRDLGGGLSGTSMILIVVFLVLFLFILVAGQFLYTRRLKSVERSQAIALATIPSPLAAAFRRARERAGATSGDPVPEYNEEIEIETGRAAAAGVELPTYTSRPLQSELVVESGGPVNEGDIGMQRLQANGRAERQTASEE